VSVEPWQDYYRPIDVGGGAQQVGFKVAVVGEDPALPGWAFLCEHFTPHLIWREAWKRHPNTALSLAEVVLSSPDPASTAALYGRIFGAPAEPAREGRRLRLGDCDLCIEPTAGGSGPPGRSIRVATGDLARARAVLAANGVRFEERAGTLAVAPADACGVAVVFA
jgi:hypothetical protein